MSASVKQVQVKLSIDDRPMDAQVELWDGPENIPIKMNVYSESGYNHPFNAIIAMPSGWNSVAIRNTGLMEFPIRGRVLPIQSTPSPYDDNNGPMMDITRNGAYSATNIEDEYLDNNVISRIGMMNDDVAPPPRLQTIQGGVTRSFAFHPSAESVQIRLQTNGGRPIQARIELMQGPKMNKQIIDINSQDGEKYPFYGVFETSILGRGSTIRIINKGPLEFPLTVLATPYKVNFRQNEMAPTIR